MFSVKAILTLALAFTKVKKCISQNPISLDSRNYDIISTNVPIPWKNILEEFSLAVGDANFKKKFSTTERKSDSDSTMYSFSTSEAQIRQLIGGNKKEIREKEIGDAPTEFPSDMDNNNGLPFDLPLLVSPFNLDCRTNVFGFTIAQISQSLGAYPLQCTSPVDSSTQSAAQNINTFIKPVGTIETSTNDLDQQSKPEYSDTTLKSNTDTIIIDKSSPEPQNIALPTEKAKISVLLEIYRMVKGLTKAELRAALMGGNSRPYELIVKIDFLLCSVLWHLEVGHDHEGRSLIDDEKKALKDLYCIFFEQMYLEIENNKLVSETQVANNIDRKIIEIGATIAKLSFIDANICRILQSNDMTPENFRVVNHLLFRKCEFNYLMINSNGQINPVQSAPCVYENMSNIARVVTQITIAPQNQGSMNGFSYHDRNGGMSQKRYYKSRASCIKNDDSYKVSKRAEAGFAQKLHLTYIIPTDKAIEDQYSPKNEYILYKHTENTEKSRYSVENYGGNLIALVSSVNNDNLKLVKEYVGKCLDAIGYAGASGNIGKDNFGFGNIGNNNIGHCNIGNNNLGSGNVGNNNYGNFNFKPNSNGGVNNKNRNYLEFNCDTNSWNDVSEILGYKRKKDDDINEYLKKLTDYISYQWTKRSEEMLGPYLPESVADILRNIIMKIKNEKVTELSFNHLPDKSFEFIDKDFVIKGSIKDVVSSFLYKISNSEFSNIYLKRDEYSSDYDLRKVYDNTDTLGVYKTLLDNRKGILFTGRNQVIGINSIITKGANEENIYSTIVIDGKVPESLKNTGTKYTNIKMNQSPEFLAQTENKREIDENSDKNKNPKVQTNFPNILYYHKGTVKQHSNDPNIGVIVDFVFVDKFLSTPKHIGELVISLDSIKENVALLRDYDKSNENNENDENIFYKRDLMGFIVKDQMVDKEDSISLKKRGNIIQELFTKDKSVSSHIGSLNHQSERYDKIPEEKKGSCHRTAMNSNNNRFSYTRKNSFKSYNKNKGSNIDSKETSMECEDQFVDQSMGRNITENPHMYLNKRQISAKVDFLGCIGERISLKEFVESRFTDVITYDLEFNSENSVYSFESLYKKKNKNDNTSKDININVQDIAGKVLTRSGIVYILEATDETKGCLPRFEYCKQVNEKENLKENSASPTIVKIVGGSMELSLLKIDRLTKTSEEYVRFVDDLGVNENESVELSTKPHFTNECIYAKYNVNINTAFIAPPINKGQYGLYPSNNLNKRNDTQSISKENKGDSMTNIFSF
ncbi:putative PPE family protein PPE13 [Smittium culicis]|uniref:Putative PPE family protein PPE13 n=1 Tax=Smittium culicis TaxID=133412 RepID=A0A1R1XSF2_9FUNG|nr:putative PPE family protein PPE13 [Smittium culicis]